MPAYWSSSPRAQHQGRRFGMKPTRVAINGLGRIGRAILKLVTDEPSIEVVAVNDVAGVEDLAYLLRFDTVYGRYSKPVAVDKGDLVVAGRKLRTLNVHDPSELPW